MNDEGNAGSNQGDSSENTRYAAATGRAVERPNSNQPESDNQQPKGKQKEKKWGHTPDTWMVVLTALIAILGVGTAWIFYRQFQEMSSQTSILRDQAKQAALDSVDAAKKVERQFALAEQQANAATESVKESKRALDATIRQSRLDERAWIGIIDSSVSEIREGVGADFRFWFGNSGKTPARRVTTRGAYRLLHSDEKFTPDVIIDRLPHLGGGVIQPGEKRYLPITIQVPLTKGQVDAIRSGAGVFYVFGDISYEDIFKNRHVTKWCFQLTTNPPPGFFPCAEYNEAN